ncbi:MAG: polysaccharide deacetylase [Acidobacteria bacterium]|nr:MAG: polysaccharide deacetylase [Acidobacteriota bacterium]
MRFIIGLLCLLSSLIVYAQARDLSVGFILYRQPPDEAFYLYDWLVVDPDNFPAERLEEKFYLRNRRTQKLIAYVSIGELEPYRVYFKEAKKEWVLGENRAWDTLVADIRKEGYREFLMKRVFPKLSGFDGFFLDTLDSYQLVLKKEEERKEYERELLNFIKNLRKAYPEKLLLINRGFEVMEGLTGVVNGLVAESLFYGIDLSRDKAYKKMKDDETQWLLERLKKAKELGFEVIVVDYVDPKDRKLARELRERIRSLGFIPFISDRYLSSLGLSLYEPIPRKVLVLYDGEVQNPYNMGATRFFFSSLEFLGFVPVTYDINRGLPDYGFMGEYMGIIVDLDSPPKDKGKFTKWLLQRVEEGIKVFFVNDIPLSDYGLKYLGIEKLGEIRAVDRPVLTKAEGWEYFEAEPSLEWGPMLRVKRGKVLLKAELRGTTFYPLVITHWGGYALKGSLVVDKGEYEYLVFNPILFFKTLFEPNFPAPDVTTENGRRILTAHIDGDASFGVADFDPSKSLMEVIKDEIIKRYQIPHTVSFIEGEISPEGLYPDKSKRLIEIARSLALLPNVELASHSLSHPFSWQSLEKLSSGLKPSTEPAPYGYNLPIKGYVFSPEREILGSVDFINRYISPEGKRVKVFLWTGDCDPSGSTLKLTYKAKLYNVNGGLTWINKLENIYSLISPMGVNKGEYFQIFAPIQNENIYTNRWTDYYGYTRVIETFKLTENPHRLKPISIYYHFYSGQKVASLKALHEVYTYALSQEVNPIFLSEYAQKVMEFRSSVFAFDTEGNMVFLSGGNLRTLRFDSDVYPNIKRSKGVVGYRKVNNSTYVHLDGSGNYRIVLSEKPPNFALLDANGKVENFEQSHSLYKFTIVSYIPTEFKLYSDGCYIDVKPKGSITEKGKGIFEFKYKEEKRVYVEARCNS